MRDVEKVMNQEFEMRNKTSEASEVRGKKKSRREKKQGLNILKPCRIFT